MKKIYLTAIAALLYTAVTAQAYEGTVRFDKSKQDAIVIEYGYPAQAVENAFVARMLKLGYKPKEEKGILNRDRGFLVFKNAAIPEISDKRYDYIVNVERKSRKEEDESVMYIIIHDKEENIVKKMDVSESGRAKEYLNTMLPDIEVADLELQIKSQEDVVAKAEKKLRDLEDEHKTLLRKIEENEKSREDTRDDIEAQRKTLELLREKRKTMD